MLSHRLDRLSQEEMCFRHHHVNLSSCGAPMWALGVCTGLGTRKDQRKQEHCCSLHSHVQRDALQGLTTKHFIPFLTADPRCPSALDRGNEIFWQTRHAKSPGRNFVAPATISVHTLDWDPCRRHIHRGPRCCECAASCFLSLTQHVLWKEKSGSIGKIRCLVTLVVLQFPSFILCL